MNFPNSNQDIRKTNNLQINAIFMGTKKSACFLNELSPAYNIRAFSSFENIHDHLDNQTFPTLPDLVLLESDQGGDCFDLVAKIKANPILRGLIIVVIATVRNRRWESLALKLKVSDYYTLPIPIDQLMERLHFLVVFKLVKSELSVLDQNVRTPRHYGVSDIIGGTARLQRIFRKK